LNKSPRLQRVVYNILKKKGLVNPEDGLNEALYKLDSLIKRGSLSFYHALLQYILVLLLYERGYDIWVEKDLPGGLVADLYAEHPLGNVIIEVETGYIPPRCIEEPMSYLMAKIVYKALLYSKFSDLFFVAVPAYISLPQEALDNRDFLLENFLKLKYCFKNSIDVKDFKISGILKIFVDKLNITPDPDLWWK
jgi:hypothetical protein